MSMYPLTKSMDFPVTMPNMTSPDDWDDAYSDDDDEGSHLPRSQRSFGDLQEDYGFFDPSHIGFQTKTMEDVGHSDESDDDDNENEPIEFDDLPTHPNLGNGRKLPTSPCCTTPWWFGEEESQHVQRIFAVYEKALGVDKERNMVLRGDLPFVGRVMRRQVLDVNGNDFMTLDAVDVYLNEQVPQGMPLTLVHHMHALTKWDQNSGLPVDCVAITRKSARTQWKPLVRPGVSAWLFCLPMCNSKSSFSYSTGRIESPMRHSNDKPFSYQQFIPKRPEEELDPQAMGFMMCGSPGSSPQRPPPKFHF